MIRGTADKGKWAINIPYARRVGRPSLQVGFQPAETDNAVVVFSHVDNDNFWFSGVDVTGLLSGTERCVCIGKVATGKLTVEVALPVDTSAEKNMIVQSVISEDGAWFRIDASAGGVTAQFKTTPRALPVGRFGFGVFSGRAAILGIPAGVEEFAV